MVGFCINLIYNTYLYYGLELQNVFEYNINIILSIIILVVYSAYLHIISKNDEKNNFDNEKSNTRYILDIIMILLYVFLNTNLKILIGVMIGLMVFTIIGKLSKKEKIPMAFIICIFTVVLNLIYNVSIYF